MGKFEILERLVKRRLSGQHDFLTYPQIHQLLKQDETGMSYFTVWRGVNGLFSDELLEVEFEEYGLQRTARFRATLTPDMQRSYLQRVHNTYPVTDQNPRPPHPKETVLHG